MIVMLAIGSFAACKSGDDVVSFAPATADFKADTRPSGVTERYVSLRVGSKNEGRIVLDLVVTEVDEPITGIVAKITYPAAFAKFIGCDDGSLFPSGKCLADEPEDGDVFLSRSVGAPGQETTVVGDQVILSIEFLVFGQDSGRIVFEGQNLGGGETSALLDIDRDPIFVDWFAGTLRGK